MKIRFRDYVKLVLGTFPYQVLLAGAAIRAAWREARGDGSWEKTEHTGAHITAAGPAAGLPAAAPDHPTTRETAEASS